MAVLVFILCRTFLVLGVDVAHQYSTLYTRVLHLKWLQTLIDSINQFLFRISFTWKRMFLEARFCLDSRPTADSFVAVLTGRQA